MLFHHLRDKWDSAQTIILFFSITNNRPVLFWSRVIYFYSVLNAPMKGGQ